MKKIFAFLLSLTIMSMALVGCGSDNSTKDASNESGSGETQTTSGSLDSIKKNGKIVMYTNATFPPYEYLANGKVAGVDVDIANEIAKDLGVELVVEDVAFESIIPSLQAGKSDFGAAAISITDERLAQAGFSNKYVSSTQYVITKKDTKVTKVTDLAGKKIGVQLGTTGHLNIDNEIKEGSLKDKKADLKPLNDALAATQALLSGKLDAIVVDKQTAENIAAKNAEKGLVSNILLKDNGEKYIDEYAIAVKKGNKGLLDSINKTLARLISEGKIDSSIKEHIEKTQVK